MVKRKGTSNDLQNITQKTKDRVTRTPPKTRGFESSVKHHNPYPYYYLITVPHTEAMGVTLCYGCQHAMDPKNCHKIEYCEANEVNTFGSCICSI